MRSVRVFGRLLRDVLLRDAAYVARVQRHYCMFRERIDASNAGPEARRVEAR